MKRWIICTGLLLMAAAVLWSQIPPTLTTALAPQTSQAFTHLSTENDDIPEPGTDTEDLQQTSALVFDVDKDGVNDFVIGLKRSPDVSAVWYQYTETGWVRHIIEDESLNLEAGGTFHDVDSDGDIDVVLGKDGSGNEIWWWENPYPNYDPDTTWTRHTIKKSGSYKHHDMIFGDFDGDGQAEFAFWNQRGRSLNVAEIPADPRNSDEWDRAEIFVWPEDSEADYEGLAVADIDLDGKDDLIGGGHWFKHESGTTYSAHVIDLEMVFVRADAAQLVPGGRPEVVFSIGDETGPIRWYEWENGSWVMHEIEEVFVNGHSLQIVDMNADGYLDIFNGEMNLYDRHPDGQAVVFLGNGKGDFYRDVLTQGFDHHESKVADLDGDGDLDLLGKPFNWQTPRLDIWINDGYDGSCESTLDTWKRHLIDDDRDGRAVFIQHGDINDDGLEDVITGRYWYENPGTISAEWTPHAIGEGFDDMIAVHDFDDDGDLDLLGTMGADNTPPFAWAENDGSGSYTVYDNISHDPSVNVFLQGVEVVQLTPDSPLEVLLSFQKGTGGLQALIVPDDPTAETWSWRVVTDVSLGEDLTHADIDEDGDIDILLGTSWLQQQPDTSLMEHIVNDPETGESDRVHLVDMDDDGDLDALMGYGHDEVGKLGWYEQLDDPTEPWTEHLLDNLTNPQSLDYADLDGDGDFDVVVGEHRQNNPSDLRALVYENVDGVGGSWQQHLIYTGDEHHDGMQLVDLDNDGDLDAISIGWKHGNVIVYENQNMICEDQPVNALEMFVPLIMR